MVFLDEDGTFRNIFDNIPLFSSIFKNREAVRFDYVPRNEREIPHRRKELRKLALILSSVLRDSVPSNVFMYGKTGTGKTVVAKFVLDQLIKKADELKKTVFVDYINCRISDTSYRIIVQLTRLLDPKIPFTGLPYDEIYMRLVEKINSQKVFFIVFLDEIDQLMKRKDDKILYSLVRMNSELRDGGLSVVGITNDLKFKETLDSRIISALSDEEIFFKPYNANQLRDILENRAEIAFHKGVLEETVIPLIAALAAQEEGDARIAIDLLRLSAELAEREGSLVVTDKHVKRAREKIKDDVLNKAIVSLPFHSKLVLYSVASLKKGQRDIITTGKVYSTYRYLCQKLNVNPLSSRSVSEIIRELDTVNLVSYDVGSIGRGRTKKIHLEVECQKIIDLLEEEI